MPNFTSIREIEEAALRQQIDAINGAVPLLEEKALMCGSIDVVAQVSLAISMKRIADMVANPSVHEALMHLAYPAVVVHAGPAG